MLKLSNLSVIAYANGFTLWHLNTNSIIDPLSTNYFVPATTLISQGDQIHISAPDGAALGVFTLNTDSPKLHILNKVIF